MKIGIVGLGKLGLPVALAMESKGHSIIAYDVNHKVYDYIIKKKIPYIEKGTEDLLKNTKIQCATKIDYLASCEIIFVAVQTPHEPEYEGSTPMPHKKKDFDYSHLKSALNELSKINPKNVVIISTVLPGTLREILPLYDFNIVYNPYFIAMGTVVSDFLDPEFVLLGGDNENTVNKVGDFYRTIHDSPLFKCTIEEAELIKVCYNTFITMKICFANAVMELAHKIGNANCDRVTMALGMATDRIISKKYLKGGMGDGGGCHPRDNIAMSWLAEKHHLSFDFFELLIRCREDQTEWLSKGIREQMKKYDLPLIILGKAFKKNTNIVTGSPAMLLAYYLDNIEFTHYDPFIDSEGIEFKKAVYFIATEHDLFKHFKYPHGSVVIDPFRFIEEKKHFKLIQLGNKRNTADNNQL